MGRWQRRFSPIPVLGTVTAAEWATMITEPGYSVLLQQIQTDLLLNRDRNLVQLILQLKHRGLPFFFSADPIRRGARLDQHSDVPLFD
ncbi:hypothetical protein AAC387_Pa11g0321 [Persea americana]